MAIKAKFTADEVIKCLNTPIDYTNVDGSKHNAPLKPLIAIRNTGEALFSELDLRPGDEVDNDFSTYLQAVYNKLFSGNFKMRKVNQYVFETESDLQSRGILTPANASTFFQASDYKVLLTDFLDQGAEISAIQKKLMGYKSVLPLSVIDYLRDRIESTPRASLY